MLSEDELPEWIDVVRAQLDAGVGLTPVMREQVEPEHAQYLSRDCFVITDRSGVHGALLHSPEADAHMFTNDGGQVRDAEKIIGIFEIYERSPEALYTHL
ncbi:hypothetical protein [Actinomadura alba]|uniref:PH domain-containing protein n=1 Tax=Actinomadura alba TaxID=406431 RepID=A0ABR7LH18_9ACTN|nr:hypothetical protein [Actinomadura alba]MBC6463889.1 hypothetical protein [Actinomadura alba]